MKAVGIPYIAVVDLDKYLISGHYVPQLSQIIVRLNKGVKNPEINFKGFLVGKSSSSLIDTCLSLHACMA